MFRVAKVPKATPEVFVQVRALDPEVVQSPDISDVLRAEPLDRATPALKLD